MLPPEGHQGLGWITVSGDNALDARDNLKHALSHIHYKVLRFDEESAMGKTQRRSRLSVATINKKMLLSASRIEKVRHSIDTSPKKLHIGIAGNSRSASLTQPYFDTIRDTLNLRGYRVSIFDFADLSHAFNELKRSTVELVINAYDGNDAFGLFKPQIVALLELLEIPFVGSGSLTLALCQDKIRMKKLFDYHQLPTPKWDYAYSFQDTISEELRYPLIVKPGETDTPFAISQNSVVKNNTELDREMKQILSVLQQPVLVEEYIEGDEYDVTILGNDTYGMQVLPLSRSVFSKFPKGQWKIYSYDASGKISKHKIVVQTPPRGINPKLEALITEIALDGYNTLHCNDYGRVELRVDADDNPYIIRVSANPPLAPDASIVQVAQIIGMDYGDLLEKIILNAVEWYRNRSPQYQLTAKSFNNL
ncbi:MAG: ATP-grasp domain-containing protein [Candidatus Magasanikbacteria bacterium]|nr:ATP-grasp domain-containing protein [Candidatus Magasanikbacteria bacterium]